MKKFIIYVILLVLGILFKPLLVLYVLYLLYKIVRPRFKIKNLSRLEIIRIKQVGSVKVYEVEVGGRSFYVNVYKNWFKVSLVYEESYSLKDYVDLNFITSLISTIPQNYITKITYIYSGNALRKVKVEVVVTAYVLKVTMSTIMNLLLEIYPYIINLRSTLENTPLSLQEEVEANVS